MKFYSSSSDLILTINGSNSISLEYFLLNFFLKTYLFFFSGTGADWFSCPAGTFSNQTGLVDISQCSPCSAGKFCQSQHLTQVSGDCDAGIEKENTIKK